MTTIIKIQSVSDIITNSSSEVFTIYTKREIESLKDMVSIIVGTPFDDLFNMEIIFYDDCALEDYEKNSLEGESYEDFCFRHDADAYEAPLYVEGFTITAKDPKDKDRARALNNLFDLFEQISLYC